MAGGESIELQNIGNGSNETPRGILRRTQTDAQERERPTHYAAIDPRTVAWSSTMPSDRMSNMEVVGASNQGPEGTNSAMGDWKHTLGRKRRMGLLPDTDTNDGLNKMVEEITHAMESDKNFMADDLDGEMKRRDAFKELTEPLAARKEIKRRLTLSTSKRKNKKVSCWQALKYSISMQMFKSRENIKATLHDYSPWHANLKVIEGIFGAGVGAYFRFLIYLMLLNAFIALLVCCFVLTPQLVVRYGDAGYKNDTAAYHLIKTHQSYDLNKAYDHPFMASGSKVSVFSGQIENSNITITFKPLDWLTGAGWLLTTELYYGSYWPVSVCMSNDCTSTYSIPFAYFFTIVGCFLLFLVVIPRRVIQLYKEHTLSGGTEMGVNIVSTVFTAWDFSITDKKAAVIKCSSISNELKALCSEVQDSETERSLLDNLKKYVYRTFWWCVIIVFSVLLSWLVYELLATGLDRIFEVSGTDYWSLSGTLLVLPAVVTTILVVLPLVLEKLVWMEKYSSPRMEIIITLARTTIMSLLVLGTVVGFWLANSPGLIGEGYDSTKSTHTNVTCWESALGAELYRLIVMDFLVQVLGSIFIMLATVCCIGRERYSWHKITDATLGRARAWTQDAFHIGTTDSHAEEGDKRASNGRHNGSVSHETPNNRPQSTSRQSSVVQQGVDVAGGREGVASPSTAAAHSRGKRSVVVNCEDVAVDASDEDNSDASDKDRSTCFMNLILEFSVAHSTLHLVYNQTLLWAGLFFAPLLTLVCVIKLFLLFYIQKFQVLHFQRPTARPWRAAHTETVFFGLILVSLVVTAIGIGFVLIRGCSSPSCGPLAGYCPFVSVIAVDNKQHTLITTILDWATKPGVVAAIIVILAISVYWARSVACGRSELVGVLRKQLEMEVKDRAYLLGLANRLNGGSNCVGALGHTASAPGFSNGVTRGSFVFSPSRQDQSEPDRSAVQSPVTVHQPDTSSTLSSHGAGF